MKSKSIAMIAAITGVLAVMGGWAIARAGQVHSESAEWARIR
jgi:hypothetical protein